MKRTLLLLAIAVLGVASLAAENVKSSTIYIIDGAKVENFDGSQLVGKTVADYYVDAEKNVHVITTAEHLGNKKVKNVAVIQTRVKVGDSEGGATGKTATVMGSYKPGEAAFVVDGKLVESSQFMSMPTSGIQSIKIVKDAGSADFKKYAAEAKKATGVEPKCIILVTTK